MSSEFVEREEFRALFAACNSFLDVRSEGEFGEAALPRSFNAPILRNEERHEVGLCYKVHGSKAALELGLKLVNGTVKEQRIARWMEFLSAHPQATLFCWRGGLRSEIAQEWVKERGATARRVRGGYKALRGFLLSEIDRIAASSKFLVVTGRTGSGKTDLLHALEGQGQTVLDLEKLAQHRGSSFGRLQIAQPRQATFENALGARLVELEARGKLIVVEDESRLIGHMALPDSLYQAMKDNALIVLEESEEGRVQRIIAEYVIDHLEHYRKSAPDPFSALEQFLLEALQRVIKSLGSERTSEIALMISAAIKLQRAGSDSGVHSAWILRLLKEYYDPFYDRHVERGAARVVFRGKAQQVIAYLLGEE